MKKRIGLILLMLVLSVFTLASCGGDYSASIDTEDMYEGGYKGDDVIENGTAVGEGGAIKDETAKIIRIVNINGESKNFEKTTEEIQGQVKDSGGYIESSDIRGGKSYINGSVDERIATYVIRIPADKLDAFLSNTKGLINVTASSESTEDVTLDYYDIQSRLDTLKSKKTALEKMLEKAESLDDILTIQESLYDVIEEIEAYQSKLNLYDNKVNYSTVNLTVQEVVEYTETELTFGERMGKAFSGGWSAFIEAGENIAVGFVYVAPFLIIPIIVGIVFLVIHIVKKRKK